MQHLQYGILYHMNTRPAFRLLLAGAGARLALAALIILALWVGFFWATGRPGAL